MNFLRAANTDQPRPRSDATVNHSTASPLDETAVRALLDRLAFVEKPVDQSGKRQNAKSSEFALLTPHTGFREPDPDSPNLFWFRKLLRGGLGGLNCEEDDFNQIFQLRYSAVLDPTIVQYFQMNGAYQMQVVDCKAELRFTPNSNASGILRTEIDDQSVVKQTFTNDFEGCQKMELEFGAAIPIDSDLSDVIATFNIAARDARLMSAGHADAAAWLTLNTLVRFDGYVDPVVNAKK